MSDLDDCQLEILGKMGVDIWQHREQKSATNTIRADSPDKGARKRIDDSEADSQEQVITPLIEPKTTVQIANQAEPTPTPDAPDTLDNVAMEINQCQRCPLHETRIKAVPGVGNLRAEWMFIGEAPGKNEDQQGEPFVGRAGQLLDAIIAALQMQRSDVFIANVVKCRPPANRDPLPEEVETCEPYLHRQLALVKPKIIVALGRISAQALLKTNEPLSALRGKVHHYGASNTPMIITYHPAYLLRSPGQKPKVWADLLLAKSIVAGEIAEKDN